MSLASVLLKGVSAAGAVSLIAGTPGPVEADTPTLGQLLRDGVVVRGGGSDFATPFRVRGGGSGFSEDDDPQGGGKGFARVASMQGPRSQTVPPGTAYWINASDVLATRRRGNVLKIGNPLAPCFTGQRVDSGHYRGGGGNQGGGYSRQTATIAVVGNRLFVTINDANLAYRRSTKTKVSKRFGGTNPADWFSDCELR